MTAAAGRYADRASPLAKRLKALREARGMTHQQLADEIDKTRTSIVQYEREFGGISPPLPVIEDLARVLDVTPAFLVYGVGEERDDPAGYSLMLGVMRRGPKGDLIRDATASVPKWWADDRFGSDGARAPSMAVYLEQAAPNFGFSAGDLVLLAEVDDEVKADNDLYVIEADGGLMVVRYVTHVSRLKGGDLFCDGYGVSHSAAVRPKILGRVVGSIRAKDASAIVQSSKPEED